MVYNTVTKANHLCVLLRERLKTFAVGDQFLTIREIMREYDVSQSVVDRALARLRADNLLAVESPRNGLIVAATSVVSEETAPAEPEILLVVPHWNSYEISEMTRKVAEINSHAESLRLKTKLFEPVAPIPRGLDKILAHAGGLILLPAAGVCNREDTEILSRYAEICPTVVFGHHYAHTGAASIGLDDVAASCRAIHHLHSHGHRHVGILVSEPFGNVIAERVRTLEVYAAIHGMRAEVIDCGIMPSENPVTKTYDTFCELIKRGFSFSALIGISGESLLGAVNACRNHDIEIPRDLSIVAIAGEDFNRTFSPPIDTVACDVPGQVEEAVKLLLELKQGNLSRPYPDRYRLTELLVRGSVARLGDPEKP